MFSISIPPNAVLASALTRRKQKARSARAVRASDGRKTLYAILVSGSASSKSRCVGMFMCKWARILLIALSKVNNFLSVISADRLIERRASDAHHAPVVGELDCFAGEEAAAVDVDALEAAAVHEQG